MSDLHIFTVHVVDLNFVSEPKLDLEPYKNIGTSYQVNIQSHQFISIPV